jgi:hypothetical protein
MNIKWFSLSLVVAPLLLYFLILTFVVFITGYDRRGVFNKGFVVIFMAIVLLIMIVALFIVVNPLSVITSSSITDWVDCSGSTPSSTVQSVSLMTSDSLSPIYYIVNPETRSLSKINLQKTIGNQKLIDYFHKNDETIFVLADGTIVSIIGSNVNKFSSLPNVKKIRILNNQYVGLANGKIYLSKDLKTWTLDNSRPNGSIVDIDVPSNQNNILFVQTPNDSILYNVSNQNAILSRGPSEKRKYGSTVDYFIKLDNNGITSNLLDSKKTFKGYTLGEIDHEDHIYIVPDRVGNMKVQDLFSSDNQAIVSLMGDETAPERIKLDANFIYQ